MHVTHQLRQVVSASRRFLWVGLALGLSLAIASAASARAVFDATDPAFNGSVAVQLPPAELGPNDTAVQFERNGVTFSVESLDGLAINAGNGIFIVQGFPSFAGVIVTINPPVVALGFTGESIDGCISARFIGSMGTEDILSSTGPCQGFFGAADIGDISAVEMPISSASGFLISELTFIPASGGPSGEADLAIHATAADPAVGHDETIEFDLDLDNLGPDTAENTLVIDFLDPNMAFSDATQGGDFNAATHAITWQPGNLAAAASLPFSLAGIAPADDPVFHCGGRILNVAVANAATVDLDLNNNLAVATTIFGAPLDDLPTTEVCGNGVDDDCDGDFECADPDCAAFCRPTLPLVDADEGDGACFGGIVEGATGQSGFLPGACSPPTNAAEHHACRATGLCGDAILPPFCCDPFSPLATSSVCVTAGCAPVDPNFKEAEPPVNIAGFGYTAAGRTMTYTIHYENVGNADALNVSIIDVLDDNLDAATLAINDGGIYNPTDRTIVWTDPQLPPATPREVSFQVDVRSSAAPGARVRNKATIIFPNAVPPSRVDTNMVEHAVPDPAVPLTPDLSVISCTETSPGSGAWWVGLVNEGIGFAYNVTATILNPPASVQVTDGVTTFAHPNDPDPSSLASVIPNATTTSADIIRFATSTPGDPCAALRWRIEWENLQNESFSQDVQAKPDGDLDAVADDRDNCPALYNPDQADANGDGVGDACDQVEDTCPNSDLRPTVIIDGCDSGVANTLFTGEPFGNGCTIADLSAKCAEDVSTHGDFVSCVAHLTNDLKAAGVITGQEEGAIQSCVAQSDIP